MNADGNESKEDTAVLIANRVGHGYSLEPLRRLAEGIAGVDEIDKIVRSFGAFRTGPFERMDLVGLDTDHGTTGSVWEQLGKSTPLAAHPLRADQIKFGDRTAGRLQTSRSAVIAVGVHLVHACSAGSPPARAVMLADKTGPGRVYGYATRLNPARGDASLCPVCNEPLIAFELEGVEIDHCVACRGTWLDAGELEQIAELAGVPAGPLRAALEATGPRTTSKRRCPRCRRKLNTVAVGDDPAVEIDRCPLEHGLWFDAGELKTLITSFAGGEAGAVAEFLGNVLRHELETGTKGE